MYNCYSLTTDCVYDKSLFINPRFNISYHTIEFLILQTIEFYFYFTSDLYRLMKDNKQSEYIRLIQEDPSLVQLTNYYGNTIFHMAAIIGRLQVMEAINNIDPHMKDRVNKLNQTPLMDATMSGRVACVKWLLDHDVDLNIKDVYGYTALYRAGNPEINHMIENK